jgi:hypothetical protein
MDRTMPIYEPLLVFKSYKGLFDFSSVVEPKLFVSASVPALDFHGVPAPDPATAVLLNIRVRHR